MVGQKVRWTSTEWVVQGGEWGIVVLVFRHVHFRELLCLSRLFQLLLLVMGTVVSIGGVLVGAALAEHMHHFPIMPRVR